jgi:Fe-S-cluster containining protein
MGETVVGCTGACCAVFYLPIPHAEFTPKRLARVKDGRRILEMALPLTLDAAAQRDADYGAGRDMSKWTDGHTYTCRYFDTRTRRCVQYDTRPKMCRDYPYKDTCGACGVKGGK